MPEMEYHPYILAQTSGLAALQAKHGIHTQAYGPLVPLIRHPDGGPIKPILQRIAARLTKESGKEVADTTALLLWTIGMGVSVVTTSGNADRIKALADIDGLPDLTSEEMDEVTEAGKTIHFRYYSVRRLFVARHKLMSGTFGQRLPGARSPDGGT